MQFPADDRVSVCNLFSCFFFRKSSAKIDDDAARAYAGTVVAAATKRYIGAVEPRETVGTRTIVIPAGERTGGQTPIRRISPETARQQTGAGENRTGQPETQTANRRDVQSDRCARRQNVRCRRVFKTGNDKPNLTRAYLRPFACTEPKLYRYVRIWFKDGCYVFVPSELLICIS